MHNWHGKTSRVWTTCVSHNRSR
uniref:Uncharacterized protein n=1 Tax=Anguilla anguilla TaxID=7936 RepID=A0A0E9P610_ANGAN